MTRLPVGELEMTILQSVIEPRVGIEMMTARMCGGGKRCCYFQTRSKKERERRGFHEGLVSYQQSKMPKGSRHMGFVNVWLLLISEYLLM